MGSFTYSSATVVSTVHTKGEYPLIYILAIGAGTSLPATAAAAAAVEAVLSLSLEAVRVLHSRLTEGSSRTTVGGRFYLMNSNHTTAYSMAAER